MAPRRGAKRRRSPGPGKLQLKKAIENQTQVAMELTHRVLLTEAKETNMVYSPLSIHVVLSMITAGTEGPTRTELLSFLKSNSLSDLNDFASTVSLTVFADGSTNGGPRLSFANGVWVEQSCPFKLGFKEAVDASYKAALESVDFKGGYEKVPPQVNSWAEEKTNGLIKGLVSCDVVNSKTRLLLANALYFKGAWKNKLRGETSYKDLDFHLLNGSKVKAPFLTSKDDQVVSVYNDFSVLKLPYHQGGDEKRCFSMLVFLPEDNDGLPGLVERVCTKPGFIDKHIPKKQVHLGLFLLPKFKISSELKNCVEILRALGLKLPFVPGGLTEMVESGDEELSVDMIVQKSCIEVNEDGTKAAAATYARVLATQASRGGRPKPPPITFEADHPFLFLIREEVTGTVLFVGHVLDTTKEN